MVWLWIRMELILTKPRDNALPDLHSDNVRPCAPDTFSFLETAVNELNSTKKSTGLVVVENTPLGSRGGQPGADHVRTALTLGGYVITANKGPAAFAHRELVDLAKRSKRELLYEGSILDDLPVFSFFVTHYQPYKSKVFWELLIRRQTIFCPR